MKRKIAWLLFILLSIPTVSTQTVRKAKTTKKELIVAKESPTTKPTREKFDPKRDPNTDLQNAIIKAGKESKRIILDVGGEWCGWCIKMDNYFLENPALARIRERDFIWLQVNFSPENENKTFFSKYPVITGYPHLFVLETDGSLLYSQNTAELEEPKNIILTPRDKANGITFEKKFAERSYDLYKFVEFFKTWSSN